MGVSMAWQVVLAGADGIGFDLASAQASCSVQTLLETKMDTMALQYRYFAFGVACGKDIRGRASGEQPMCRVKCQKSIAVSKLGKPRNPLSSLKTVMVTLGVSCRPVPPSPGAPSVTK